MTPPPFPTPQGVLFVTMLFDSCVCNSYKLYETILHWCSKMIAEFTRGAVKFF